MRTAAISLWGPPLYLRRGGVFGLGRKPVLNSGPTPLRSDPNFRASKGVAAQKGGMPSRSLYLDNLVQICIVQRLALADVTTGCAGV